MVDKEYYSPLEIAEKFSVKHHTVLGWIRKGKLKAIKLGDLWRVHHKDLEEFIKQSSKK